MKPTINVRIPSNKIPDDVEVWLALEASMIAAGGEEYYDGWDAGPFPGGWFEMTKEQRRQENRRANIFRTLFFYYPSEDIRNKHLKALQYEVPSYVQVIESDT